MRAIKYLLLPGIQRDKTIADKLMYIPNDDTQNYLFCRLKLVFKHLNTQLIETTNQKVPKVIKSRNKKVISAHCLLVL